MMVRSAAWGWGAFAASAAVHGSVLVTALGHPGNVAAQVEGPTAAALDIVAPELDPIAPATREDRTAGASAPRHAHPHTHSYPVPPSHDWTDHDPSLVHVFAGLPAQPAVPSVDSPEQAASPAAEPLPRFTIAIGAAEAPQGPDPATGGPSRGEGGDAQGTESEQTVSSPARLVRGLSPAYPSEARAQGIEADVPLEIVVSVDGAVESARSLGRAGFGFDQSAIQAIRQYRFAPASRQGRAVRVRMRWTMEFRLR